MHSPDAFSFIFRLGAPAARRFLHFSPLEGASGPLRGHFPSFFASARLRRADSFYFFPLPACGAHVFRLFLAGQLTSVESVGQIFLDFGLDFPIC